MPPDNRRLWICIITSVVVHLLLLLLWALGADQWIKPRLPEKPAAVMALTLVPPPQAAPKPAMRTPRFVPTVESQRAPDENPNAVLESERNTRQRSNVADARDPSSNLPEMKGRHEASASYMERDTPGAKPTTAALASAKPAPAQPPAPPAQPPLPPSPKPSTPDASPRPTPQPDAAALAVLPAQPSPTAAQQEAARPQNRPQASPAANPEAPRPPPSFSADVHGGGASGAPSPESRETELGRYKAKVYRAVGGRWHIKVNSNLSTLAIGSVRIRFFIRANGVVENLQIIEDSGLADGRTAVLRTLSRQSITESGPFEPFSEQLKAQLGEGYEEEFGFTIY